MHTTTLFDARLIINLNFFTINHVLLELRDKIIPIANTVVQHHTQMHLFLKPLCVLSSL